jgi:hypothetical protein
MLQWARLGLCGGILVVMTGCLSVSAPKEINVGSSKPYPVDSGRVPQPQTLGEAQDIIDRAYANLQYYEEELGRCERKAKEYKRERDRCEDRLERYEDD